MEWRRISESIMRRAQRSFGEDIVYTPAGGLVAPFTVRGIFQAAHTETDPEGTAPFSTTQPRVDLTLADLPVVPRQGDVLLIAGVNYRVFDKNFDGYAMIRLLLSEV